MITSSLLDDAVQAAQHLLGSFLVRELDGQELVGRIVETEAYDQTDAASHSYRGRTPRTDVMFGTSGHAYVYFTYGMHYCFNIVTGKGGEGSAVLVRALEPIEGVETMSELRGQKDLHNLCNGPAKLCQALAINKEFNGHDLNKEPLQLVLSEPLPGSQIAQTTRIGITRDSHRKWRFYIKNNPYVSKK